MLNALQGRHSLYPGDLLEQQDMGTGYQTNSL